MLSEPAIADVAVFKRVGVAATTTWSRLVNGPFDFAGFTETSDSEFSAEVAGGFDEVGYVRIVPIEWNVGFPVPIVTEAKVC
jgi:hypothetical protein